MTASSECYVTPVGAAHLVFLEIPIVLGGSGRTVLQHAMNNSKKEKKPAVTLEAITDRSL